MAHDGRKGSRRVAAAAAVAIACAASDAAALALGDARVRSALGEPLEVRVPVTLASGESIEPSCFTIARDAGGEIPRVTGARISLERSASGAQLRIQTAAPLNEPAFLLGIVAACGQAGEVKRDYSLLLDPPAAGRVPQSFAGSAATARAKPEATSLRAIAATLVARIGDTLESIANAIFPRNRAAKRSYIEALRDTNPTLAALGENDPIPVDTPIALPDLRTFARAHPLRPTQVARDEAGAAPARREPVATRPRREPRATPQPVERAAPAARATPQPVERQAPAPRVAATAPAPSGTAAPAAPRRARDDGFVLRLSSSQVDLTRSRAIDDRLRAQLRERQMILDQDDQVAALLALRHSVKQLEGKVAELQLKLAGMPSSFPPPRATIEPPKVEAPPARVEPAPAPKVEAAAPSKVEAPPPAKVEASPPPKVEPPPPPVAKVEAIAPKVEATPPPKVEATPAPKLETTPAKVQDRPIPRRTVSEQEWITYALWALALLLLFGALYLAWKLWQRRREEAAYEEEIEEPEAVEPRHAPADDQIVVADEHVAAPEPAAAKVEYSTDGRRIIDADVELPTRLGNDSEDLRRRYIEERFPEITKGAIDLDDAASVVKGARLFYEDGALTRAVELLQFAIERNPAEVRPWLALFEIFRLERLTGEFAALAQRFRDKHGASPYWPKVQYFGREIDAGNALYQQPPLDRFETIGPAQARRLAADNFDPIAENWLGAPMDFENEVLANDLRKAVMAEAGIVEADLLPNPMPALRNVEMFTVA